MKSMYKQGNAESVAAQAASELKNCSFIVYCADDRQFAAISTKLHELMPEVKMIGTTGFMIHDSFSVLTTIEVFLLIKMSRKTT